MTYRQPNDREKYLMRIGGFDTLKAMEEYLSRPISEEEEEPVELPSEGVQELEDPEDEEEPNPST